MIQITGAGLSLISTIAFANLLPKEVFGMYKYILSLVALLNIFGLLGMGTAITQAVASGHDGIFKKTVFYQLRWGVTIFCAALIAVVYYWVQNNTLLAIAFFIFGLTLPIVNSFGSYGSFIIGKKDFKTSAIFGALEQGLILVIVVATILLTDNLLAIILAYALASIGVNLLLYHLTLKKYRPPNESENIEAVKQYGRRLSPLEALGIFTQQLDKILVLKFSNSTELAIYAIASAVPDRLKSMVKSFVSISFPKLSTRSVAEIQKSLRKRIVQCFLFGIAVSVAYILISPIFFKFFLPKYQGSILYSQLLSLSTIFLVPTFFMGYAIAAQKFVRANYFINIFTSATKFILYIVLGFIWGPLGIVVARVVSYVSVFFFTLICWQIEIKKLRHQGGQTSAPVEVDGEIELDV